MSYTWALTATEVSWKPMNETPCPISSLRYAGTRRGLVSTATRLSPDWTPAIPTSPTPRNWHVPGHCTQAS